MDLIAHLQQRVRRHLKKRPDLTPTALGLLLGNNPSLVPRILRGQFSLKTYRKVLKYLDKHE